MSPSNKIAFILSWEGLSGVQEHFRNCRKLVYLPPEEEDAREGEQSKVGWKSRVDSSHEKKVSVGPVGTEKAFEV